MAARLFSVTARFSCNRSSNQSFVSQPFRVVLLSPLSRKSDVDDEPVAEVASTPLVVFQRSIFLQDMKILPHGVRVAIFPFVSSKYSSIPNKIEKRSGRKKITDGDDGVS